MLAAFKVGLTVCTVLVWKVNVSMKTCSQLWYFAGLIFTFSIVLDKKSEDHFIHEDSYYGDQKYLYKQIMAIHPMAVEIF